MTAKPQQPDPASADDLIAELARLMAQDAGPEKTAETPAFSLRIPGEPSGPISSVPAPRFDFSAAGADEPKPVPNPTAEASAAPAPQPDVPATTDPFRFDFVSQPQEAEPAVPVEPATLPNEDAIAQLIEAEFANAHASPQPVAAEPAPEPTLEPTVSTAEAVAAPQPDPVQDQFRIPPVFGLGGATRSEAAPAPSIDRPRADQPSVEPVVNDPIDDIESLIGRAIKVGRDRPSAAPQQDRQVEPVVDFVPAPEPQPAPAPRSLATPTLKPPPQPSTDSRLSAADETIMAAAHATGAQLEWVDEPEAELAPPPQRERPRSRPRLVFSRAVAGPLIAVTLLLAAGFGLYWVLGLGTPEGPAPLLAASTDPVKEVPEAPEASAPQQSVVFTEMAGGADAADEQLVSRDQTDAVDVASAPTLPASAETAANRKVRTVTVRPDGTIVSGEDSLAGGAILPVARPDVPEVPGAAGETPLLASTGAAATGAATGTSSTVPALPAEAQAAIAETAPTPAVTPVEPGTYVAAVDVAGNPIPGKTAPVPMRKPQFSTAVLAAAAQAVLPQTSDSANSLVPQGTQQASLPPPPAANAMAPSAPAASAGSEAPAYVQLSSQRSEEAARATAQQIVARYGPLFGGANLEVQRVDLGERGIFYRVRAPAGSLAEANTICTNVKAAGGDCFTM